MMNIRQFLTQMREQRLFWRFSLISLVAFVIMTAFVIVVIRPAIEEFVLTDAQRQIVVFVNRLTQQHLQPSDFIYPASEETLSRLGSLSQTLPVRGLIAVVYHDSEGRILYSSHPAATKLHEIVPHAYEEAEEAVTGERAIVEFETAPDEVAEDLGARELFETYIPVTFGGVVQPVGVVHTISRTGFIRESITLTQREIATRIILGSIALYLALSVIVYGASRTIIRQAEGLKQYADRLAVSLQKEKELSAAKDEFLRVASHQLNTPVSEIGWAVETINEPKISKELFRTGLQSIENGFHSLQNIVSDILTVSEIGMSYKKHKSEPVDLADLTREVLLFVAQRVREKKLSVLFVPPLRLPLVDASRFDIQRVLRNIIDNAITYSNDGGTVRITISAGKDAVIWKIKDEGIGIPPAEQGKIFEQFFRAKNAVEKKNVGTGLGLFLSKTIVEGHGGKIGVESAVGKGTTISFSLPRGAEAAAAEKT